MVRACPAHVLVSDDEGVDLQLALGKVIRAMGVKEFAGKVSVASPNVPRAVNRRHNPTQDTLNRLLKPFKLRLSLAPLTGKSRRTGHDAPARINGATRTGWHVAHGTAGTVLSSA